VSKGREDAVSEILIGDWTMRRASLIIGFLEPGEWWKMHLEY
jgi:hypothetical protein